MLQTQNPPGFDIKYKLLDYINRGAFGCVYIAENMQTKQVCAAKFINLNDLPDRSLAAYSLNEIQILKKLRGKCPYFIEIIDDYINQNFHVIVMEMCQYTLMSYLERIKFQPNQVLSLINQLNDGILTLHQMDFIHRDIKPENVLIQIRNGNPIIKIVDFGFCQSSQHLRHTILGTPNFMAPEINNQLGYGKGVDIFALGKMIEEVLGQVARLDHRVEIVEFLQRMTDPQPDRRPQIGEVKEFFQQRQNKKRNIYLILDEQELGQSSYKEQLQPVQKQQEQKKMQEFMNQFSLIKSQRQHLSLKKTSKEDPSDCFPMDLQLVIVIQASIESSKKQLNSLVDQCRSKQITPNEEVETIQRIKRRRLQIQDYQQMTYQFLSQLNPDLISEILQFLISKKLKLQNEKNQDLKQVTSFVYANAQNKEFKSTSESSKSQTRLIINYGFDQRPSEEAKNKNQKHFHSSLPAQEAQEDSDQDKGVMKKQNHKN